MNNIGYKFYILRNNVKYKSISGSYSGMIFCDKTASIKRSISCSLILPEDVNFLSDELMVSLVKNGIEKSLGVFMITTLPRKVSVHGSVFYECEGYDRTYRLERTRLETRTAGAILQGTPYTEAIGRFLVQAGIKDYNITETDMVLSEDREDWEIGTSYLEIVNTLLNEINYNSIWIDSNGVARSEPYTSPIERTVDFKYGAFDGAIVREHTSEIDYFSAYNVFVVGASNLADEPIYATSVNDDPNSIISTIHRGRIMAPVTMLDSAPDIASVQQYADNLVLKSRISSETAKIQTSIEAGHEVNNVVAVNLPELSGKFEEIAWSIPLSTGLMEHTIRRAVYV